MNEHNVHLEGCRPVPLGSYLKALGLTKIVSEQADNRTTGHWEGDVYVLRSRMGSNELVRFLMEEYSPTPILAPWNGGSGFYPKDKTGRVALGWLLSSSTPRLVDFREAIEQAKLIVGTRDTKPSEDDKEAMLEMCRSTLSDRAIDWLDSVFVLTEDGAKYPPLLGTGGNDGRLEFTSNFQQRLSDVMDKNGCPTPDSEKWLRAALFSDNIPGTLQSQAIGQFYPARVGGSNSTSGFERETLMNPWDYLLMIEGTLTFASGVVRKLEGTGIGSLSYPFCVKPTGIGYGSASKSDESASQAEIWVPLWSTPSTYEELRTLFSEGRSNVQGRRARDGIDFARAVATLGVDRGIRAFQRYSFLKRNGRAYYAVPLGRFSVQRNPQAELLAQIDQWLIQFRRAASSDKAPASMQDIAIRLDNAIMQLCTDESTTSVQQMLMTLGECERRMVKSKGWVKEQGIRPIGSLSQEWFARGFDGTPEYRIAASVALLSMKIEADGKVVHHHMRSMVDPVAIARSQLSTSIHWDENASVKPFEGRPVKILNDLMERRIVEHQVRRQSTYMDVSPVTASLSDIIAFQEGILDDERIIDLFWGMTLLNPLARYPSADDAEEKGFPGAAYAVMKLCFAGGGAPGEPASRWGCFPMPLVAEIHRRASAGEALSATTLASRRLRGSGANPMIGGVDLGADRMERIASSTIIPLGPKGLQTLNERVIKEEENV